MRRRELLVGAGGLAGGSSLIVSSNAFTSVEAERELQVDIVGDEEAYLALHYSDDVDNGSGRTATVTCGEHVTLFDIRNRFSAPINTLEVGVDDDRFEISVDSDSLGPGDDPALVQLETNFSNGCTEGSFEITVEIEASGDGFSVDAERDFKIEVEVRPQFECLEAIVEQTGNEGNNAKSVEFRYRLNVASNVKFKVEGENHEREADGEDREGEADGEEEEPCKGDVQNPCAVKVNLDQGNFRLPIKITAWIGGQKLEGHPITWRSGHDKHIPLVGGGCSDQS